MSPKIVHASTYLSQSDGEFIKGLVQGGGRIVLPTDTVYGIGANPYSTIAVDELLAAKGRGRQMPPPVLTASPDVLSDVSSDLNSCAKRLIERFWPGALTLIVKAAPNIRFDLGDIEDTIAVRMPDHQVALEVLRIVGPLAVTSANLTGQAAATRVKEAVDYFGDDVQCYIDSGPTSGPVPSTIVDVTRSQPVLLRAGVIALEDIEQACGLKVLVKP